MTFMIWPVKVAFAALGPGSGGERFQVRSPGLGQALENILQVLSRINSMPPATAQHRIDDGATLSGLGMADEQEVFLSDGGGPDGILTKVVMYALGRCRGSPGENPGWRYRSSQKR